MTLVTNYKYTVHSKQTCMNSSISLFKRNANNGPVKFQEKLKFDNLQSNAYTVIRNQLPKAIEMLTNILKIEC